jgi:hypothetical protein
MDADRSLPVVSQSLVESEATVRLRARHLSLFSTTSVASYPGTLLPAPFPPSVANPSPSYDVSAFGYLYMTLCITL